MRANPTPAPTRKGVFLQLECSRGQGFVCLSLQFVITKCNTAGTPKSANFRATQHWRHKGLHSCLLRGYIYIYIVRTAVFGVHISGPPIVDDLLLQNTALLYEVNRKRLYGVTWLQLVDYNYNLDKFPQGLQAADTSTNQGLNPKPKP